MTVSFRFHKPGAGRPRSTGRPAGKRQMPIWFTDAMLRRLSHLSEIRGVSKAHIVREAVAKAI